MRYIKTFESFYHEDDMVREIAGFLDCSIERIEFDPKYKDTSMFRGYSIDGRVDDEALEALRAYMENEHGLIMTTIWNISVLNGNVLDKIFLTEKSLKETCIDWLNKNYSGMEAVENKDNPDRVRYRDILFYNKKDNIVYVVYDLIWSFFNDYFGLEDQVIKDITAEWLSETYNLRSVKTNWI